METTEATHEAEPTYDDFGGEQPVAKEQQPLEYMSYEAPAYGGGFDASTSGAIPAIEEENELTYVFVWFVGMERLLRC